MPDRPFEKVSPGSPLAISAADWNTLGDAARAFLRQRRGRDGPALTRQRQPWPAVYALVRWDVTAIPEFSCVTYADAPIKPTDAPSSFAAADAPVFVGGTPARGTDPVMILTEPAPRDGFARAVVSGLAVVDVNVTDAGHAFATATPGDTSKLTSGMRGQALILYKPSGTGTQRCIVWLAGPDRANDGLLMGKLDGDLNYQSGATLSLWAWDGSADADTGVNITVYDWLLSSGQSVASGKRVVAGFDGGRWRVIGAQCS
ncbi:MAG: hypothetical protein K2P78_04180 [Gemmataceae bacterium]|nr:hypothetical protein [Gemmataceae bacterium]